MNIRNLLLFSVIVLAMLSSCKKDKPVLDTPIGTNKYEAEVATEWFDLMLDLSKSCPGYTPPVAARSFGYAGVTLYESVVHGMPTHQSLAGQLNGLSASAIRKPVSTENYHWPLVANSALSKIVQNMYPNAPDADKARIIALEQELNTEFSAVVKEDDFLRSVEFGRGVAEDVYQWSLTDGGHECYLNNFPASYVAPTGPGFWVPTKPGFQTALQPWWGQNRPFVKQNLNVTAPPHPAYSTDQSSVFFNQVMEVYNVTAAVTPAQQDIADFWSDDPAKTSTPGGHSVSILNQIVKKDKIKLGSAAEAYALLGMGISDAFISCWKSKYKYNLVRPVSVINDHVDNAWTPRLNTPPFPEYPSGHSVQSGAAAEILTNIFGTGYTFTDRTHENRTDINGSPRTFNSFHEFANEAAISRLYGGIHYRFAIDDGLTQGYQIGQNVSKLKTRK